ncbi:MAG: 50S ribosomal protein L4 [Pelagibacteraceae bacterium TMED237]|nr:MAG: 50S ribosomal protein L4 [Pelagibacteraceae bacterium TMED237]|tara:strand:+ start:2824 stop:3447 length:624 start_codon:yes stop_codon:yes gene_type:complete
MKKPVLNLKNSEVGNVDLDSNIFGLKILPDIIHQYIRYQNAKSRQGSHTTKSRSEVNGRSKKPFSQKGTGNARQGSSKPPNFRGGAVSMGPDNRNYSFSLNKKEKKLALKSALSSKLSENKIIFIDSFKIDNHKTKELHIKLNKFEYSSALFIYSDEGIDKNFKLASSNIPRISILSQKGINVKDIITYDKLFIEKKSLEEITKRLS